MVVIRELTTLAEMEEVQVIEHKVWGIPPIPTYQTLTAVKNGGIMIGAYDGDKMVGFSYGFPGFKDGKIYLCSHMLGIDTAYRSQGIGERLKWKQREIAIAKGYDRMHWTYDPLETRNGYLNLTKLNGICDTYIENSKGRDLTDKVAAEVLERQLHFVDKKQAKLILKQLRSDCQQHIQGALEPAEQQQQKALAQATAAMQQQLERELTRLQQLQQRNPYVRPSEVLAVQDRQAGLLEAFAQPLLQLDAARIIINIPE